MARSTVHYADNKTNNALKKLHNKLRPAGTPVQRVEYIIELLLLRIFETKIKQDEEFKPLRKLFTSDYRWKNPKTGQEESNENRLFSYLPTVTNEQISAELNDNFFPFYSTILQSARQVFEGNLPQKVQDQLVLIEEVFSNSNFTNNVNSGNLGEVIGIVANDIEESRLLKTDLLGDAIESALSETGGTKDIGLFRTPDHVRQFMTALVEPTFDDLVFDPACGTGGFLFDAFEFVMRRVDSTRDWPGEKSHSELCDWFDIYFKDHSINFPSIEQTTQFYRSGVAGIEYLGMIRKMAAINFYIRGLNPANIQQGDSLAKYNAVTDAGSKTVVVANPPFGAERDQEAYPDVWGEYAKESETTILFVKLMFELLKDTGRCAVIVSEGFHTWDQNSAKALRKIMLDEAHLKAIISLPQGLFVSKGGQGPKTSILLYEKGGKTDWVWFYKVSKDGYTMGTNRREQKGNQLVECLNLFYKYVKQGKQPPASKHQFCIPAEWIKTLDPRIKEKIRTETRADMEAKGKLDRIKKSEELDRKIASKKLLETGKQMELKLFDQMLENRIQNEIAKRIDKAHNYSFNLSNYKSTLSGSQISEWKEAIKNVTPNSSTTLEEIYKKLYKTNPEVSLPYLAKLNPSNALEADIAREYVSNLDENICIGYKEINTIKNIINSSVKYDREKLGNILTIKRDILKLETFNPDYRIVEKIRFKDGEMILRNESETGIDLQFVEMGNLLISKINFHQGATAINNYGKVLASLDYLVYDVDRAKALPEYVQIMVRNQNFIQYVSENKPGGIKGRSKPEFIEMLEIPLPSPDEQTVIVTQIEKQKAIVEGAEKVLLNWKMLETDFIKPEVNYNHIIIDNFAIVGTGSTPSREVNEYFEGENNWVLTNEVAMNEISVTIEKLSNSAIQDYGLKIYPAGTILIAMYGQGKTRGQTALLNIPAAITQNCGAIVVDSQIAEPKYVWFFLMSIYDKIRGQDYSGGGVPHLNLSIVKQIRVPLPDIETQRLIVAELDAKMQVLNGLRNMKVEAEKKIKKILAQVWCVEFIETIKEEVEDE